MAAIAKRGTTHLTTAQRANAYRLLEDALNLRDTKIYDTVMEDGKEKAFYYRRTIVPAMEHLRTPVDELEMLVDKKFWPIRLIAIAILAGAWGNMIDRMLYAYVVDFFYFKLINFPIFNVADIYVSVGTVILVVLVLFYYKDEDMDRLLVKKEKQA